MAKLQIRRTLGIVVALTLLLAAGCAPNASALPTTPAPTNTELATLTAVPTETLVAPTLAPTETFAPPTSTQAATAPAPTSTATRVVASPVAALAEPREVVARILAARQKGDAQAELDEYSSSTSWQFADATVMQLFRAHPCPLVPESAQMRVRCLGKEQIRSALEFLAELKPSIEVQSVTALVSRKRGSEFINAKIPLVVVRYKLMPKFSEANAAKQAEVREEYVFDPETHQVNHVSTIIVAYPNTDAAPAAFPNGFYSSDKGPDEIREVGHTGTWEMGLMDDGRLYLFTDGYLAGTANYNMISKQLMMTDDSDCMVPEPGVHGGTQTSVYSISKTTDGLALTPADDGCPIRRDIFTGGWKMEP